MSVPAARELARGVARILDDELGEHGLAGRVRVSCLPTERSDGACFVWVEAWPLDRHEAGMLASALAALGGFPEGSP